VPAHKRVPHLLDCLLTAAKFSFSTFGIQLSR
jgi:hypothetical protein